MSLFAIINSPILPKLMMQYFFDMPNVRALFIILKDQKLIHIYLKMIFFKGRYL